jgi:hypothetical protein
MSRKRENTSAEGGPMTPKSEDSLPAALEVAIEELLTEARKRWLAGDLTRAEALVLEAWAMIPEPKLAYGTGQILSRGAVTFFLETRQFSKAREWLSVVETRYGREDAATLRLRGQIAFEEGAMDEAAESLGHLYAADGARGFEGLDPKYLQFARSQTTAPRRT